MTSGPALDGWEVEALVTDRYLEALLAAADRGAPDAPADPTLDPAVRSAAHRLRAELVRVHPSFRFEERLARRLAEAASGLRLAAASGGEATVLPFPSPILDDAGPSDAGLAAELAEELANPELAALLGALPGGQAEGDGPPGSGTSRGAPTGPDRRPLLVGGAVTSAALSLAGAAFVAWRLTRGAPADPMARAVRLARAARAGRDILPRGLA
jgi:hypothetical protein